MEASASLEQVKAAFKDGIPHQAIALAQTRDTRSIRDSNLHVAWADVLEELGLADEVILELNLAIRDDPERIEVYPRLAEILLDQGQPHRASKVYAALANREPQEPRWYEEHAAALKEAKEARRITYREVSGKTGVATSTISAFMNDKVSLFYAETIDRLCAFYGCEPGDIIIRVPEERVAA